MTNSEFPPGWDAQNIKELIDFYEGMSDDEQVLDDEAAFSETQGQTVIVVPDDLLPAIRQLLAAQGHDEVSI